MAINLTGKLRAKMTEINLNQIDVLKNIFGLKESEVDYQDGFIPRPFNFQEAKNFRFKNEHQTSCLETKTSSLFGLGLKKEEVETELDDICRESFIVTMSEVAMDFWELGNGFLEVVFDDSGIPSRLYHQPADLFEIHLFKEQRLFVCKQEDGRSKVFAHYGEELPEGYDIDSVGETEPAASKIIHFRKYAGHPFYGIPEWLAAVHSLEIMHAMQKYSYGVFYNRAIPDFITWIIGTNLHKDVENLVQKLELNLGPTNAGKTNVFHLNRSPQDANVKFQALTKETSTGLVYDPKMSESLDLRIVSAHGVPPLLAGIQIPGKLGATNELPNALVSFQLLRIGPAQKYFVNMLYNSLGKELDRSREDFAPKTLIEEMNLPVMDTMSRMREPLSSTDRDLEEGLRD